MPSNLKCPHCQSNNLINVPIADMLKQFMSSLVIGFMAESLKARFRSFFRNRPPGNAIGKKCESCKGYSVLCSVCRHIFKVTNDYKFWDGFICPKCDATLS